jgi:hypothetical protein
MEIAVKYEVSLKGDRQDAIEKMKAIRQMLETSSSGKENGSFQLRLFMKDFCMVIISPLHPCPNFAAEVERTTGDKVRVY